MSKNQDFTVEETFDMMPGYFLKEMAEGLEGIVQFEIQGEGGGKWGAIIENDVCKIVRGEVENPDVTITTEGENWVDVCIGNITGMELFSEGELSVNGDVALAMKLDEIFLKYNEE